ncbi:MAG TPA: transglycosylase SLT domain-containing protein, partial [Capillimicrobium sp.]
AAAAADGVTLVIASAYRSNAEQQVLWNANPDPKWVAPPGTSLHRLATELDLGPSSAYPWLAANAPRFGFTMRYSWEPWHWGYTRNPSSSPAMSARREGSGGSAIPSFVPAAYVGPLARAAQRWNVSATLLAAQLEQESGFDPRAVSPAGAQGIAQFMPATAAAYGLTDPFDPVAAIDAQAHLMRDLLRQFGSVPLALAAYNAGPAPVSACGCVPPYPETTAYVAAILGRMGGAGDPDGFAALDVRLVR